MSSHMHIKVKKMTCWFYLFRGGQKIKLLFFFIPYLLRDLNFRWLIKQSYLKIIQLDLKHKWHVDALKKFAEKINNRMRRLENREIAYEFN